LSEGFEPIRSYQRIFRPERRLYAVEGRALPVPGGVPLRWLGWASGALVFVIALSSGSPLVLGLIATTASLAGLAVGGRSAALLAAVGALAVGWLAGAVLASVDWPLRLVVAPVAVATLATQATPDGRRADRFAASWLALRLAPRRRSLGRALPAVGAPHLYGGELWVAPDERSPVLRRGRVGGEAIVSFAAPIAVRRAGARQRRLLVRPPRRRALRGEIVTARLALGEGEALEVRR
jgi:hypothetical protein